MITRKELTGRLHHVTERMEHYRGPMTVTIPSTTVRAWVIELKRLEAAIHALPDMRPIGPPSDW